MKRNTVYTVIWNAYTDIALPSQCRTGDCTFLPVPSATAGSPAIMDNYGLITVKILTRGIPAPSAKPGGKWGGRLKVCGNMVSVAQGIEHGRSWSAAGTALAEV